MLLVPPASSFLGLSRFSQLLPSLENYVLLIENRIIKDVCTSPSRPSPLPHPLSSTCPTSVNDSLIQNCKSIELHC